MSNIERFEEKYIPEPNSGCWLWIAATDYDGYGVFYFDGKVTKAPRAAYLIFIGKVPSGLQVLHKCDIPACVNPDHLFLGTIADNMADKVKKNRQAKGSSVRHKGVDHGMSKLTEKQVLAIRKDKRVQMIIAKDYGVSDVQVSYIKSHKSWSHLK